MEVIISHAHRFVFVKTRKTAGTSMQKYLQRFCDPETDIITGISRSEGENWNFEDTPFAHPKKRTKGDGHIGLRDILERAPEVRDYYRFTVERNPWAKAVSMWWWLKRAHNRKLPFSRCVRTNKWLPLDWDKYSIDGQRRCNVLLYERFEDHIPALGEDLGLPLNYEAFSEVRLKSLYRPEGDEYRMHYTDKMRKIIAEKFGREIEAFGYEF